MSDTIIIDVMPLEYFHPPPKAIHVHKESSRLQLIRQGDEKMFTKTFAVNGDDSLKVIMALY